MSGDLSKKGGRSRLGLNLLATLRGHESEIGRMAWSPDGTRLASASRDRRIRLWDIATSSCLLIDMPWAAGSVSWSPDGARIVCAAAGNVSKIWIYSAESGRLERTLRLEDVSWVTDVRWSPDGKYIVAGSTEGLLTLFETRTWDAKVIEAAPRAIDVVAWNGAGQLASASRDGVVRIWDQHGYETGVPLAAIGVAQRGPIMGLAWTPDGQSLASSGRGAVISVVDLATSSKLRELEAHTGTVTSLDYSVSGEILYSKSIDGTVRLWRTDSWECISVLEEPSKDKRWWLSGCAAHPSEFRLATLGFGDREIRLWEVRKEALIAGSAETSTSHYSNAKVVLVGDTGVGKSGLGMVLAGEPYQPTDSTHGRKIWMLSAESMDEAGQPVDRETYLWDLAGQPGYRLVHQLHLNETAVALIVFDARSEIDPFAGVRHWALALRQAERLNPSVYSTSKVLVAARGDRGGTPVGEERLRGFLKEYSFENYIKTSAKDGWGVDELLLTIREAIPWEALPRVSSTQLFTDIRGFLSRERQAGRLLTREDDLYRAFLVSEQRERGYAREEFATCVGRADSRGLIKRLSFGSLVLLQPELLDSYASALVNAAKDEPDGMGSIKEDDALSGHFVMSASERLAEPEMERLFLIATVEDLLRHEVALREQGEDGTYLVFPTQFTRERPLLQEMPAKATVIAFEGPVQHVYATLVVRLAHSGVFLGAKMWRNAVTFAGLGGRCGLMIDEILDGQGTITLFFDPSTSSDTRAQFESFVLRHLRRRAAPESVKVQQVVNCNGCSWEIPPDLIERMKEVNRRVLPCPICSSSTSLDREDGELRASRIHLLAMDRTADKQTERAAARAVLLGKERTDDYDVFLAHNSKDQELVEQLYKNLRARGINPWFDRKAIPPGRWFQQVIQEAIPRVRAAAVVLGHHGIGQWQMLELRSFISQCVERELPTIPVFLPNVVAVPTELAFLRELNSVQFTNSISEREPLDMLVWGITGELPT